MATNTPPLAVIVNFKEDKVRIPVENEDTVSKLMEKAASRLQKSKHIPEKVLVETLFDQDGAELYEEDLVNRLCLYEQKLYAKYKIGNIQYCARLPQELAYQVPTDPTIQAAKNLLSELHTENQNLLTERNNHLSKLAKQRNSRITNHTMITRDSHFRTAVLDGEMIVDKSLVIEKLIEQGKVLVTFPRRWGKSFNMNMIKAFFEVEFDRFGNSLPEDLCINRKLFEQAAHDAYGNRVPMRIMENKQLVEEHFGQYIVLKLDLQNSSGNFGQLFRRLSTSISQLYTDFQFLQLLVTSQKAETIQKGVKCREAPMSNDSIGFLKTSLQYLAKILYDYYRRDIIILVDEYDCPSNNIFRNITDLKEREDALSLFRDILGNAIKGQEHVRFAMLTGILRLGKGASLSPLNSLNEYNIMRPEFARFYGFTQHEVETLFRFMEFKNNYLEQVKNMYNGYRFGDNEPVYNPWSLTRCLNSAISNRKEKRQSFGQGTNRTIRNYWNNSANIRHVAPLLLHHSVLDKLGQMLNPAQRTTTFDIVDPLDAEDMDILGKMVACMREDKPVVFREYHVNILFTFLTYQGYFSVETIREDDVREQTQYTISIPNQEIRHEISRIVNIALNGEPNASSVFNVKSRLKKFIQDFAKVDQQALDTFGQEFRALFQEFIVQLPKFAPFEAEPQPESYIHANENVVHCLLTSIIIDDTKSSFFSQIL